MPVSGANERLCNSSAAQSNPYLSAIKQKALHLQGFLFNEVRFNC